MKKLLLFLIPLFFVFLGCEREPRKTIIITNQTPPTTEVTEKEPVVEQPIKSIPRTEWDADNIYLTNTSSEPDPSYRWFLSRKSGTTGIIGKFQYEVEQQLNNGRGYDIDTYIFNDTGYFEYTSSGYTDAGQYISNTQKGTFVISKHNDNCFKFVLNTTTMNGVAVLNTTTKYYKVSSQGLIVSLSEF